jgi:hypothetical protein
MSLTEPDPGGQLITDPPDPKHCVEPDSDSHREAGSGSKTAALVGLEASPGASLVEVQD